MNLEEENRCFTYIFICNQK